MHKQDIFVRLVRLATIVSFSQKSRLCKPFLTGKILDIGCGDARLASFISPENYTGIDTSQKMLEKAKASHPSHLFYLMDSTDNRQMFSTFKPNQFDTIVLLNVIEYIKDSSPLISSCQELLKDGGNIIITTPHHVIGKVMKFLFKQAGGRETNRSYDKRSLISLLTESFDISNFKRYNLGLSYFVVAQSKKSPLESFG